MEALSTKMPVIRTLTSKDLDRVAEIGAKILGQSRPEYWEIKLAMVEKGSPMSSLVAELEGEMIGFVIGYASG